jgi:hypothetical protein
MKDTRTKNELALDAKFKFGNNRRAQGKPSIRLSRERVFADRGTPLGHECEGIVSQP